MCVYVAHVFFQQQQQNKTSKRGLCCSNVFRSYLYFYVPGLNSSVDVCMYSTYV